MKKYLLSLVFVLSPMLSFAQSESVKPTFGVTLEREVAFALIEKEAYKNVLVELKAAQFAELFAEGVKVTVKDAETGKKIFKKRFSQSYLYAYSDGSIQVGKGNALTQLILGKSPDSGEWLLEIKQKGIY